ncbi:hypothetical protein [Streptomyces chilikensis]|uniref:hypothetical protein n=1 Tax=Streptomyces chilikensis TaxID=1194079 RepID=UPI0014084C4F|nr:hypothetical protein [Streptomyces chilikensis]
MADIYADATRFPDSKYFSPATRKLIKARDEAHSRFVDFESDNYGVLRDDYRRVAEAADERAAREAIKDGRDPLAGEPQVDRVDRLRPRVLGAARELVTEVKRADVAAVRAVKGEAVNVLAAAEAESTAAGERYIAAWNAMQAAREEYGRALNLRTWALAWTIPGVSPDFAGQVDMPHTAFGRRAQDIDGRDVWGAAEVAKIEESFAQAAEPLPDPMVEVRRTDGSPVGRMKASHAAHFISRDEAELVHPEEMPDYLMRSAT